MGPARRDKLDEIRYVVPEIRLAAQADRHDAPREQRGDVERDEIAVDLRIQAQRRHDRDAEAFGHVGLDHVGIDHAHDELGPEPMVAERRRNKNVSRNQCLFFYSIVTGAIVAPD